MPTNFTQALETPTPGIAINQLSQNTTGPAALASVAESISSIVEGQKEKQDTRAIGSFNENLAMLDEEGDFQLKSIADQKARIEERMAALPAEDQLAMADYTRQLARLHAREKQTGREVVGARNALMREAIRRAPHLTQEFAKAGTAYLGYLKEADQYISSFDEKDPYVAAEGKIREAALATGLPPAYIRSVGQHEQTKLMQQHKVAEMKAQGEELTPLLMAVVRTNVVDEYNMKIQGLQYEYGSGRMDATKYAHDLDVYRNQAMQTLNQLLAQASGYMQDENGVWARDPDGTPILFSETTISNFMSEIDTSYTQAMAARDDLSAVTRINDIRAVQTHEALQYAKETYQEFAAWIQLAPSEAFTWIHGAREEAINLLWKKPLALIQEAAASGNKTAMLAVGEVRRGLTLEVLDAAAKENRARVDQANMLLAKLARGEAIEMPPDMLKWMPLYTDRLATIAGDESAPPYIMQGARENLTGRILDGYNYAIGKNLPMKASELDDFKGGVLPKWWNGDKEREYYKSHPAEREQLVSQHISRTNQMINDTFTFGFNGGWGRLAENVSLRDGKFIVTDQFGSPSQYLNNRVMLLNAEIDMMKALGYSYDDVVSRQEDIYKRIAGHAKEYREFADTFKDLAGQAARALPGPAGHPAVIGVRDYKAIQLVLEMLGYGTVEPLPISEAPELRNEIEVGLNDTPEQIAEKLAKLNGQ